MLRRQSGRLLRQWDPDKLRGVKKLFSAHREALDHAYAQHANNRDQYLDVDDQGPALYMGHMNKGLRDINRFAAGYDFIVEMRDARLPFSTGSPTLDDIGTDKPRLLVFNKSDMANQEVNRLVQHYYESKGHYALFTNAKHTWRDTVEAVQKFVSFILPRKEHSTLAYVGCVVGMPNVGKTTLLNSLRLAHHHEHHRPDMRQRASMRAVGMTPGTTRVVSMVHLSRDPHIVVYDTPGLVMPQANTRVQALRLTAVGIIECNASSLTHGIVSRYIYGVMEGSGATAHLAECLRLPRPPISYEDCMQLLAERSGSAGFSTHAMTATTIAEKMIIEDFRRGKLGRITLDKIPDNVVKTAANPTPAAQLGTASSTGTKSTAPEGDADAAMGSVASIDPREYMFTHDVRSEDVAPPHPPSMEEVMTQLHRADVVDFTASTDRGERAASTPRHTAGDGGAAYRVDVADTTGAGVISRRKVPIATETAESVASHCRFRTTAAALAQADAERLKSMQARTGQRKKTVGRV